MTETARRENALVELFRIPIFRRMWAAITLSSLGDWLGLLANTALAQQLTSAHSLQLQGAAISGVLLVRLAPDLIFGAVAAAIADKFDRRKIVIAGEVTAALLYGSIAIGYNLLWLYIAQFVIEAVGLFTQPAKQAIWIAIPPKRLLATGTQLSLVSVYGTVPVASAIFALLSSANRVLFGSNADHPGHVNPAIIIALAFDSVTFLVSAATVFLSRHQIVARPGDQERGQTIFTLLREGVSFVRHHPLIRGLYVGIIGAFAGGGLTVGVAQLWVLTLSAGAAGYSIMFGTVFTGLAIGMLVGPHVLPRLSRARIFGLSIGAAGLTLIGAAFIRDFILAVTFAAAIGFFAGMAWIVGYTLIGQEVEDRLRGRIFAFVLSSVRLTLLASIAVGPNVAGAIGTHGIDIGDSRLILSGPGMTLLIAGLLAFLASWYASSRATPGRTRLRDLARTLVLRTGLARRLDHKGLFITVDGVDAEVTAAYARLLADAVRARGLSLTETAENAPAEGDGIEPETAALRSAADRSEHVNAVIRPALVQRQVVISDRYVLTSLAVHGAGAGADIERIRGVNAWSTGELQPDLGLVVPSGSPEVRQALRDEVGLNPDRYVACSGEVPRQLPAAVLARLNQLIDVRSSLIRTVSVRARTSAEP